MFPPTFWVPACSAVGFSTKMWKVFTVNWATPWVRAAGETDARHSVSSQLVKYNIIGATIFMTFRTQIHIKKFGKNGFRNLQGTMSHRPLTNTSSLKSLQLTSAHIGLLFTFYNLNFHILFSLYLNLLNGSALWKTCSKSICTQETSKISWPFFLEIIGQTVQRVGRISASFNN